MRHEYSEITINHYQVDINLSIEFDRKSNLCPGTKQKIIIMEVITIESKAFKELQAKINTIASYITAQQESVSSEDGDIWVDSYEVCTFLKISSRTLQRLRSDGVIKYSKIRGRNYYQISEIKRLIESRVIKSNQEFMQDLIANHKRYVKERRNTK